LLAATLYQEYHDMNHKLWNIVWTKARTHRFRFRLRPNKRHLIYIYVHYHALLVKIKKIVRESRSREVYSIQHYMINFVSDLRQVGGFLRVLRIPPSIRLTATI
jgi:hypothetical protein